MIDKALIIVIFFYSFGFISVGLEYSVSQIWHVEMVSPLTGEPMNSQIVGYLQQDNLNEKSTNIINANYTANSTFFDKIETFTTAAAFVAWELVALMTGTYIFRTMLLLGVPAWFVTSFIVIYGLLLARAIIGYIRGI